MNTQGVVLSLPGEVALITGGSRGIGAATVKAFVRAGAKVMFNYHEAREAADSLVAECGEDNCRAVRADLSSLDGVNDLVEATVARWGRIDHLVANHGIWPAENIPVDQMTELHWSRTIGTNLNSVFGLLKSAVAQMKSQPRQPGRAAGHIVLVSSTAGQRGEAYHVDYAASKGALISMVKGLSTELAPHGIYVNCIAPGWVETDMARPVLENEKSRAAALNSIPLGRMARPEEIAVPILFLCTPYAGFVTGEIFNVNGGAVLVG
ncbi:MAG TPA: SDR family oxidoreductase [Terriglobales bacterium]|nr:SDR family oxidoreductase [Terriglobales bacterium]